MNETQIDILGAFDAVMQIFIEVWNDPNTSKTQVAAAYGGACALLILCKKTTDIRDKANHAAILLNQAAKQLGLPQTN